MKLTESEKLKVKQFAKSLVEKKVLKETLDKNHLDRMNSLVDRNDLKKLQVAAESLFNTLSDDGFQNDDIDEYLLMQIKKVGIR